MKRGCSRLQAFAFYFRKLTIPLHARFQEVPHVIGYPSDWFRHCTGLLLLVLRRRNELTLLDLFLGLRFVTNRLTLAGSCNRPLKLHLFPASKIKVGLAVPPFLKTAITHLIAIVSNMF